MVGVAHTIAKVGGLCFVAGFGLTWGGCAKDAPEPALLGRFRPTPAVNVILDSLGTTDEPVAAWENGEDPKPQDVVATARRDRTLRPGDRLRVSIYELLQEGLMTTKECVVSETGKISIPEVGLVPAGGLTEAELEREIRKTLAPAILKKPYISVTRVNSEPQMYAVLGAGVMKPDRYTMSGDGLRLTDALAAAGGVKQFNVSHVYVSRKEESGQLGPAMGPAGGMDLIAPQTNATAPKPDTKNDAVIPPPVVGPDGVPQPSQPAEKFENQREMLDLITPSAKIGPMPQGSGQKTENDVTPLAPLPDPTDISASVLPGGFRLITPAKPSQPVKPSQDEVVQSLTEFGGSGPNPAARPSKDQNAGNKGEWIFQNGKWVHVAAPNTEQSPPDTGRKSETPDLGRPDLNRSTAPRSGTAPLRVQPGAGSPPPEEQAEWVFQDGRWVQIRAAKPDATKPPLMAAPVGPTLPAEKPPAEFPWDQGTQTRVIKIPADRLLAGDPRYNVIIRPGDVIYVPEDIVGEFCITGNVVRPGCYSLTGRPMTLKQAIAVAHGLAPMASPKYCEIVRRITPTKELIDMVDLDKIASGEQPDFFIKPNDLINVGTNPSPEWRARMREAQKSGSGLAFVYGRNFSDADYGPGPRGGP